MYSTYFKNLDEYNKSCWITGPSRSWGRHLQLAHKDATMNASHVLELCLPIRPQHRPKAANVGPPDAAAAACSLMNRLAGAFLLPCWFKMQRNEGWSCSKCSLVNAASCPYVRNTKSRGQLPAAGELDTRRRRTMCTLLTRHDPPKGCCKNGEHLLVDAWSII